MAFPTNNVLLGKKKVLVGIQLIVIDVLARFHEDHEGIPLYESTNENLGQLRFQRQQTCKSKGDPKGKIKHRDIVTIGNENPGP